MPLCLEYALNLSLKTRVIMVKVELIEYRECLEIPNSRKYTKSIRIRREGFF